MEGILDSMGYSPAADPDGASLLLYNTCSIRDKSEQKVRPHCGIVACSEFFCCDATQAADDSPFTHGHSSVRWMQLYSALGRQRARRRADPNMRIVVAGCVAQQEGEMLLRRVPELDLVMGPQHANRLQELLEQVRRPLLPRSFLTAESPRGVETAAPCRRAGAISVTPALSS